MIFDSFARIVALAAELDDNFLMVGRRHTGTGPVEVDDDLDGPVQIMKLTEHGINQGDIKKLQEAGFTTVESVAYTPKKTLINVKGLSEAKIDKILEAAQKLVPMNFQTASSFFEKRKSLVFLKQL